MFGLQSISTADHVIILRLTSSNLQHMNLNGLQTQSFKWTYVMQVDVPVIHLYLL